MASSPTRQASQNHALLTVGRALATVRTRDDLFRVMNEQLKTLLRYEDCGLYLFTEDLAFSRALVPILDTGRQKHRYVDQLFGRMVPIPEYFRAFCFDSSVNLRIWHEIDLLTEGSKTAQFALETGIRALVVFKLIWAGRLLGVWAVYYVSDADLDADINDSVLSFFDGIAQQLTLAVSNVLANEAISACEYEQFVQVAVGEALLIHRDWSAMTTALAHELHQQFPFNVLGVTLVAASDKPEQSYEISLQKDGNWSCQDGCSFLQYQNLSRSQYADLTTPRLAAFAQPAIQVGDAYDEQCRENRFADLVRQRHGLRSALYLPVPLKHGGTALLFLGSQAGYAFAGADLDLLIRLRPQIALGLENYLAFEEITRLKELSEHDSSRLRQELNQVKAIIASSPSLFAFFQQLVPNTGSDLPQLPNSTQPATLNEVERNAIIQALLQTNGRIRGQGGAAEWLAIAPNTLDARMRKLGIRKSDYSPKK